MTIGTPHPSKSDQPKGAVLDVFDATALVGLRVRVHNAVIVTIDEDGDEEFEIPDHKELLASAAVRRSLIPLRLRGWELRAIRKIMGLTAAEMANKLGDKTAAETLSRWENEKQPMGGYAEKAFRLLVCEELKDQAPGIAYDAGTIAHMRVLDPWVTHSEFEVPYIDLYRISLRHEDTGKVEPAWQLPEAA